MDERRRFEADAERIETERHLAGPESAWPARELRALHLDEIWTSSTIAGLAISREEIEALVERGRAVGGHPLDRYLVVADYAAAARHVRRLPPAGGRRPYLRLDEIVALHALAARRSDGATPGAWRRRTLPAFEGGMVPVPFWNVPQEMAAFTDRLASGPAAGVTPVRWAAEAHERFERIAPFSTANGRVGRLLLNLLLRRLGLPPALTARRDARAYMPALRHADSGDPWPLAALIARAVLANLLRLRAARSLDELVPLAELAANPRERAALYKAAQRGRLQTLSRRGRLLCAPAWLAEYRGSREEG